jgi:hypothetical protein
MLSDARTQAAQAMATLQNSRWSGKRTAEAHPTLRLRCVWRRGCVIAAKQALHYARLSQFGARCQTRESLRIVLLRHGGALVRRQHSDQFTQCICALIWRQLRECIGVCLLNRIRRRSAQKIAVTLQRLLVTQARGWTGCSMWTLLTSLASEQKVENTHRNTPFVHYSV